MTRYSPYLVFALALLILAAAFVLSPAEAAAGVQWCRDCS